VIAAIFADVLKLERVGIHDDFFELGGHSLHAMRCVARVRAAFGVGISVLVLFETRTVATFGVCVASAIREEVETMSPAQVAKELRPANLERLPLDA
jgi:acyl carrier protein